MGMRKKVAQESFDIQYVAEAAQLQREIHKLSLPEGVEIVGVFRDVEKQER